jgi:hypothetical protein
MAGPSKQELADIQIILDQIRKSYNDLGKSNPFSSNKAKDFVGQVHILRDALNQVNEELVDMDGEIGDLQDAWQSVVEEVNAYSNAQRQSKKEISNINELSQKLKAHQKGINTLSSEEIKKIGEKVSMSKEILSSNQAILEQQIRDLELKKQTQVLTTKENNELVNKKILVANINGMLTNQVGLLTNTEQKIEEQYQTQLKVEKSMGVMHGLLKGIQKIPIIGQLVDSKEILDKTEEKLKLLGPNAGKWERGIVAVNSVLGETRKQLISGILNPANLINGAIVMLIKAFKGVDDGAGKMAKSMNITYSEALNVREGLTEAANATGDNVVTAQRLQDTLLAINETTGIRVTSNSKDLETMTKMREQAGFLDAESINLQKTAKLNNTTVDQNNIKILGTIKLYNAKNKLGLNEKTILKDVANMTSSLKLSLGNNVEKMTESAAKAKEFGINLSQAESISKGLLNFESSISDELSAELLLGKDLNFERARGLALNGDIAAASTEILNQVGSAKKFGDMNVIQQEQIAKAVGMQRDELAQSLEDKEYALQLGAKEGQSAQARYQELRNQGMSQAQIQAEYGETANQQMYEQQSIQERFNDTVLKLQDIFVGVADAVMPILNIFSGIFNVIGKINQFTDGWVSKIAALGIALGSISSIKRTILGFQIAGNAQAAISLATENGSFSLATLRSALEKETLGTKILAYTLSLKQILSEKITLGLEKLIGVTKMTSLTRFAAADLAFGAKKIAQLGAQAALWAIANPLMALTGVAAAGVIGAMVSKYSSMKDGEIDYKKGPVISTGYDQVQIDPKDSAFFSGTDGKVKVGTDLMGTKKNNTQSQSSSPSVNMDTTNKLLAQLIETNRQQKSIEFDGRRLNNTTSMSSYKVN